MNAKTVGAAVVLGAIGGAVTALRVDYLALQSFKTLEQFATYDWKIAGKRALQGAVIGAVTGLGGGSLL